MPEYREGKKIETTETEGKKQGKGTIQGGEESEVGGRSRNGLVICPYCYTANWCSPGYDFYICGHCGRAFT